MDQTVVHGEAASGVSDVPLVVDMDGILTRADVLVEALVAAVVERPLRIFSLLSHLFAGRANFEAGLADIVDPAAASPPFRTEVMEHVKSERAKGRRVYLVTARTRRWADSIAAEIDIFDGVFASEGHAPLEGEARAAALSEALGEGGFDYIGDTAADQPVRARARRVYSVGPPAKPARREDPRNSGLMFFSPNQSLIRPTFRAMRPHQWAKNLLVFLPALAAHRFDLATLWTLVAAFVSFGSVASAVYLVNDIVDLRADRDHPRKRRRPFASGELPVTHGLILAPLLFIAGLATAAAVSPKLLAVQGAYVVATFAYSLRLKRFPIIDVAALAVLYTVRIVGGGVAAGIWLSPWMLAFSAFLFLSLAMVKRLTELVARAKKHANEPAGRGYRLEDIPVLTSLAGAAGYAAVIVLALYIESADMQRLYHAAYGLWAVAGLLLFWISRVLLIAQRGEMHDDPIVFAFSDRTSQVTGALVVGAVLASSLG